MPMVLENAKVDDITVTPILDYFILYEYFIRVTSLRRVIETYIIISVDYICHQQVKGT
jgi:hypothetical protein